MMSCGEISNVQTYFRSFRFVFIFMLRLSLSFIRRSHDHAYMRASALYFFLLSVLFFSLIPEIITSGYCWPRYFYRSRVTLDIHMYHFDMDRGTYPGYLV